MNLEAIFCDNEGCIVTGKGLSHNLKELDRLQNLLQQIPQFAMCTGRSIPYVEAMVQILGLVDSNIPNICEGGAALYWPITDRWEMIGGIGNFDDILANVPHEIFRIELGKVNCLTLYPNPPETVKSLYDCIDNIDGLHGLNVTTSVAAVDITLAGVDKGFAVSHVCQRLDIQLTDILCIGDSDNDISMLHKAGYSACPANASKRVKEICDYVATAENTEGVIQIIEHFQ